MILTRDDIFLNKYRNEILSYYADILNTPVFVDMCIYDQRTLKYFSKIIYTQNKKSLPASLLEKYEDDYSCILNKLK